MNNTYYIRATMIGFMFLVLAIILGPYIWRSAVAWFLKCPFFHSSECQIDKCSCGRLGRDKAPTNEQ